MIRRLVSRRQAEAAARRRHPTACWVPDLEEMRRRLEARTVSPAPYQAKKAEQL